MFRIDRNFVKLGAVRTVITSKAENGINEDAYDANDGVIEVGVAGEGPDTAASAAAMAHLILSAAEAESRAKAHDILKKAEEEALAKAEAEAEEVLCNARKEAAELMNGAREQAGEVRSAARQEGYNEGAEEGKRYYDELLADKLRELDDDHAAKTDAIIREDDEKLKRVIDELNNEWARANDILEEQTVALSIEIVRKIINPSEEGSGEAFEMLIRNALRQVNPGRKVIIRISPAEYERFFPSGNAVFELDGGAVVEASLLRDAALGEGDCIIDAEDETVNVGLDSQLKYIRFAFDRAGGS